MRKAPFFFSTICVTSLAVLSWAAYSTLASASRRHGADVFNKSIDNEVNSRFSTGVDELVAAYGPTDAAQLIEAKVRTTETIAFDGTSRLVKIVKHTKQWTGPDKSSKGYSDGIVLKSFRHDASAVWDGPMGTRISGVRFVDGELVVSIHGNLHIGTSIRAIPQGSPEDYIVPWPIEAKPSPGSLYDSVVTRHHRDG